MEQNEIAQADREIKERQRRKEEAYIEQKIVDFGLERLARFIEYHPDPERQMLSGHTFGHLGLESVVEAIELGLPWAVVSGINPSGPLHFGHVSIFNQLLWYQEQGAEIFIPITNDETYLTGKADSLDESRRIAYEQVIPSIAAFGFDPERTHIFVHSDYPSIYSIALDLSREFTLDRVRGVFGIDGASENPGTLFYRGGIQLADILLPQYPALGGPKPTIVPVGIDQHPYVLLARDVAKRRGLIPPAEVVSRFIWGFDGKGKMSSSRERSALHLTSDPDDAARIIRSSWTGGSPIAQYQRAHGGIPEICPIYTFRTVALSRPDSEVGEPCRDGSLLCGACKNDATQEANAYLAAHQAIKVDIEPFLLRIDPFAEH